MITKTDMKNIIVANLSDQRILAIQLFISALIKRTPVAYDGVEQYRIKKTSDGSDIATLSEFMSALDANWLTYEYYKSSDRLGGDRTHPVLVRIKNMHITLGDNEYDAGYTSMFGSGVKEFGFLVNYLSDGDEVLPLKIFEVRLVAVNS